ncbi:alpha-glucosidase [Enterococcus sp. DIV2402]|uniref:Alpha-glucosidase n=1 Tax=Candidatus Enterococcus lowellii TaxID=2230877 RepID=A0ABZ2SPP1_9ENTE|nr:alpha-glucosidase [Enterococcus sp. DIV2402]MBO0463724.1 alpha-glucosidase [Enterococcus sp. DIV2402]
MRTWWKEAVGYQIYPRSFKDSNNDGIGDINGIREKLGYLKELGIDFIWITPIYASPNFDNGYDISDYCAISSDFGTMEEFKELVNEAKRLEIKIIMDLVINHTSNQHNWFEKSRQKDPNYRDFYIWHEPVNGKEPNDWQSIFGGSVWTYDKVREEYYFHTFAKEQPDLNWDSPAMKNKIVEMIEWWANQGIDGFRIDAISHIKKEKWDQPNNDPKRPFKAFQNVEGIGEYLTELNTIFKKHNLMTVGEASGVTAEEAEVWVGKDGYFNMIFEFEHTGLWRTANDEQPFKQFKEALVRWQEACANDKGWNALYMENHDLPRSISVYGDDSSVYRTISGKALAMAFMLLQGTPFIYQGQEIGMTNTTFDSIDEVNATDTIYMYHQLITNGYSETQALEQISAVTRDNARTPMQWDGSEFAGFSETKPWLKVNQNKGSVNVKLEQEDANSIFNFYKQLIQLRKNHPVFVSGEFRYVETEAEPVFHYERRNEQEQYAIVVNLSKEEQAFVSLDELTDNKLVLSNYLDYDFSKLRPFEARLYKLS